MEAVANASIVGIAFGGAEEEGNAACSKGGLGVTTFFAWFTLLSQHASQNYPL